MSVFCMLATGGVVLFVWFSTLATISPALVKGPALLSFVMGLALFLRAVRMNDEAGARDGEPRLRQARNRGRERRGF